MLFRSCRRQTSPIAGTIFASTHLPLRLWFRAIYHLTQTKQGISSIELGRRLGVTQTTAWTDISQMGLAARLSSAYRIGQSQLAASSNRSPSRAGTRRPRDSRKLWDIQPATRPSGHTTPQDRRPGRA